MILDKALLVKGAVGAASVAGLGGVVVFRKELGIVKESSDSKGKSSSDDSIDQNLQTTEPKTNNRENLANGDNSDDDHNDHQQQEHQVSQGDEREHLGLPKGCKLDEGASSKTCSITKEDLAKIDFSNKGNEDLTVEGMNGESITLVITKLDGDETYPNGKKYTFKGFTETIKIKIENSQDNFITLEGGVDNDFKENSNNKLEKVLRKVLSDQDINDLNAKIQNLGLPKDCNFNKEKEQDDRAAISCEIEELENLKKIKFSDKTDDKELEVEGGDDESLTNLKLKIKKLIEKEKTDYGNDLDGDLLFTFQDLDETVKWNDSSKKTVFLPKKINGEFKLVNQKLSKLWTPAILGQKVGLNCQGSNKECTIPDTLSFMKDSKYFKNLSMSSASSSKFKFSEDEENYNQGFKYTYEGNGVTSGSFTLSNNDKFEIKYEKEQGWYLSHKS